MTKETVLEMLKRVLDAANRDTSWEEGETLDDALDAASSLLSEYELEQQYEQNKL